MACFHPLLATASGKNENGKANVRIWSKADAVLWESSHNNRKFEKREDFLPLPCGKCIGCRLEYSRQWANRMMLELKYHQSSYFVTLTYDDYHLRRGFAVDKETGEVLEIPTLCKRDWQLFMKRLRKRFPEQKLRFFCSGEYGENTLRPHMHAIIFGLCLDDLKPYKRSEQGFAYFTSDTLNSVWSENGQQIGYVVVAPVTWETCAYTARYVVKKLNGKYADVYSDLGIVPEFSLMSRKPGIGREYYNDHKELWNYDFINLATDTQGLKFHPPRYFEKLYELEYPSDAELRKLRKKECAKLKAANERLLTELSAEEQMDINENALNARISALKRNII